MKFNLNLLLVLLTLAGSAQAMNPRAEEERFLEELENLSEEELVDDLLTEEQMFPGLEDDFQEMMMLEEINRRTEQPQQVEVREAQQEIPEVPGYEQYRFGRPITFRQYYNGDEQLGIPEHKPYVDREVQVGRMIQLSGLGLTSLEGIDEVPGIREDLRSLLLSNNLFDEIPPIIGTLLPNLVRLYMGQNQITEIPAFIFNMHNLQWLELHNNRLTTLPVSLNKLTSLTRLKLDGNKILITVQTAVPDFGQLNHLQELYIYNNPIPLGEQELRKKLNLKSNVHSYFKDRRQEAFEYEFLNAIRSENETMFRKMLKELLTQPIVPIGYDTMGDENLYTYLNIATIRDANGNNILHAIVSALSKKIEEINNSPDLSDETKKQEAARAELKYTKMFLILFDRGIPQMQQMLFTTNADGLSVISAAIGAEGGLHGLLLKTLLDYAYAVEPRVTAQETARVLQRIQTSSGSKEKEEKEGKETMAEKTAREQKAREDREWQEIREREQIRRLEDKRLRELREEEGL